jgi:hypothetical protein
VSVCESEKQAIELRTAEDVLWLDEWPLEASDTLPAGVSILIDSLNQVRLTQLPCQLSVVEGRLHMNFSQPEVQKILSEPNQGFQILCAPYSEA